MDSIQHSNIQTTSPPVYLNDEDNFKYFNKVIRISANYYLFVLGIPSFRIPAMYDVSESGVRENQHVANKLETPEFI